MGQVTYVKGSLKVIYGVEQIGSGEQNKIKNNAQSKIKYVLLNYLAFNMCLERQNIKELCDQVSTFKLAYIEVL